MKPPPQNNQPTSQELLDDLLNFIRRQFYADTPAAFFKDRSRLLKWVVLYPAGWLNKRGVSIPPARYKAIVTGILLDALRYGNTSKVTYIPAWLRHVLQTHFSHHGEEYYEEAKALRNVVEHTLLVAGQAVRSEGPDPVRELAQAARLISFKKKTRPQAPGASKNPQLNLL